MKTGAKREKRTKEGNCFALSFAGIIQIRFEGISHPENAFQDP